MISFEKNRASTALDHDIAETIDERTVVQTPDLDTDLEKQKAGRRISTESQMTSVEIPDGGVMAWGTVFGA